VSILGDVSIYAASTGVGLGEMLALWKVAVGRRRGCDRGAVSGSSGGVASDPIRVLVAGASAARSAPISFAPGIKWSSSTVFTINVAAIHGGPGLKTKTGRSVSPSTAAHSRRTAWPGAASNHISSGVKGGSIPRGRRAPLPPFPSARTAMSSRRESGLN